MGYTTTKHANGTITNFWPDDTETIMYIDGSFGHFSLSDIMDRIKEKWPTADFANIAISSEHIHTDCLYYDLYDGNDWTQFVVIELKG